MFYFDRVKETSTTTGTGNLTLAGAATGYRSFTSAYATNTRFAYCIAAGSEWEVGQGYLSASTTLVRETVFASSNAGALVNFSAGTKDVFVTLPARDVYPPIQSIADTNATALATDAAVLYTSITAARTVTLPLAAALNPGQALLIGDVSGSVTNTITITLARAGSDTINGATSYVLRTPRGLVTLVSNGVSAWYVDVVDPNRGGVIETERSLDSNALVIPGVESSSIATRGMTANRTYYEYFEVRRACVLTALFTEVTVAAAAASVTRMGVYACNNVGTIGALMIDAGTVACDSTGVKSITGLTTVLPPGFYAKAHNSTGAPTLRIARGGSRIAGIDSGMGANSLFGLRYVSAATIGSLPDPGTAPNGAGAASTPFEHAVLMRVS